MANETEARVPAFAMVEMVAPVLQSVALHSATPTLPSESVNTITGLSSVPIAICVPRSNVESPGWVSNTPSDVMVVDEHVVSAQAATRRVLSG